MNNAKSTYKKGTIESVILFVLSPIFSLPAILHNIAKGNEFGNRLLIIFCSLISFLYIPSFSNDKMWYLESYAVFKK
ncbi:hypothetical protein VSO92_12570 [Myroides pelagicus]|uniref:hypothetical protein n=1 Tax=Myroides pelagicus TaxID=270914 RepID=UPI002DB76B08|nr:hypothetical protein [Myroides pelagicus]MEC4114936.1 hypothetical protein [Myroides pelagicus]